MHVHPLFMSTLVIPMLFFLEILEELVDLEYFSHKCTSLKHCFVVPSRDPYVPRRDFSPLLYTHVREKAHLLTATASAILDYSNLLMHVCAVTKF